MFENKLALQAYMSGDIFKAVIENADWSDHLVRHFEVHSEASDIQNMLKQSATQEMHLPAQSWAEVTGLCLP